MTRCIRQILAHPLTRDIDLDDPATTELRRDIIRHNRFLLRVYEKWYRAIGAAIPSGSEPVVELGAGAGFMTDYIPGLVTTEIFKCPGIDLVMDAQRMPFAKDSLRGLVMTNVLHHIPDAHRFLAEALRCVRPGGVVAMIEPWVTGWSRWVYRNLHHEPFMPDTPRWEFPSTGPLSGANEALPWIIFERDKARFVSEFPGWRIAQVRLHTPFQYLVSGGVSMRQLMPGWSYFAWEGLEAALSPVMSQLAMFALIVLSRS